LLKTHYSLHLRQKKNTLDLKLSIYKTKYGLAKANYIGALKQTLTNKSISWEIQKKPQTDFNWEAQWQQLYLLAEDRYSDLQFYKDDLRFCIIL
jgi:hypothetical protein